MFFLILKTQENKVGPVHELFGTLILYTMYISGLILAQNLLIVANTLAKWKKLEPNDINFSQGFSQKVVSTRGGFCCQ